MDSPKGKNKSNKLKISDQGEVNINIKAPDNNGVSHNQYLRFSTSKGVTVQFNNDAKQNKNMLAQGTESEKLIINQVNSTKKTKLNGLLQVKGSPVKVVIVNPNGISCNDCQFSNTTRVDLVAGKMNYANNTINYQINQGKIIFTGHGIRGNGSSPIDGTGKILSNLAVYTRNIHLNNGAKVNVTKQYYVVGNFKIDLSTGTNYGNRRTLGLAGEKTKFTLEKNSQIHANKLRTITSNSSYLNNKGQLSLPPMTNMKVICILKQDRISNKHIITAYETIKHNEYSMPSLINLTAKHLINNQDAGIEASEGIVTFETYQGE
ncbi:MAG: filamentous hemagglutinin N-terminal domain-containing protein [Arsenophonus endosymbiont of Dermacentor nuttalli]